MPKRAKTSEEKAHLANIAALGCIICQSPACCHHIRHGQGMGQRASHFETIPLCHYHHQGAEGIHTIGRKNWETRYGAEIELLQKTLSLLAMP